VLITVLPDVAKSLSTSMTLVAVKESKPVVGSSKKIRFGFVINSTPIEVLFLSPPEIPLRSAPPILVSAHLLSFRLSIIS